MAGHCSSPKARAEHYRALAALTSDELTHRVLIEMACELEGVRPLAEAQPEPLPRSFS
jgi:hypothetical protein